MCVCVCNGYIYFQAKLLLHFFLSFFLYQAVICRSLAAQMALCIKLYNKVIYFLEVVSITPPVAVDYYSLRLRIALAYTDDDRKKAFDFGQMR